jgi:uncharacterized paraquat-inducible protein A
MAETSGNPDVMPEHTKLCDGCGGVTKVLVRTRWSRPAFADCPRCGVEGIPTGVIADWSEIEKESLRAEG